MTNTPEASAPPPWWRGTDAGRRLVGKRAFVTGAGSDPGGDLMGIGDAIAVLFAAQGATVAVADISSKRAQATLDRVEAIGGTGVLAVGDLSRETDNARAVARAAEALGGLDTVVNCVAISGGGGSPVDADLNTWDRVMQVNVNSALLTTRHALPHLKEAGGGAIINLSSAAGVRGLGAGAYAASKAALIGLTRDWAYTHGRDLIRVNCLVPGHAYTPMGAGGDDDMRRARVAASLLGTEGTAWDVAWPAVFLASDESRWVTGVELPIDAGAIASSALAINLLNVRRPVA
jgi:NAD(P)-dependent dehydrogenase (short-subunit alcohol dehydrogenase family)